MDTIIKTLKPYCTENNVDIINITAKTLSIKKKKLLVRKFKNTRVLYLFRLNEINKHLANIGDVEIEEEGVISYIYNYEMNKPFTGSFSKSILKDKSDDLIHRFIDNIIKVNEIECSICCEQILECKAQKGCANCYQPFCVPCYYKLIDGNIESLVKTSYLECPYCKENIGIEMETYMQVKKEYLNILLPRLSENHPYSIVKRAIETLLILGEDDIAEVYKGFFTKNFRNNRSKSDFLSQIKDRYHSELNDKYYDSENEDLYIEGFLMPIQQVRVTLMMG